MNKTRTRYHIVVYCNSYLYAYSRYSNKSIILHTYFIWAFISVAVGQLYMIPSGRCALFLMQKHQAGDAAYASSDHLLIVDARAGVSHLITQISELVYVQIHKEDTYYMYGAPRRQPSRPASIPYADIDTTRG